MRPVLSPNTQAILLLTAPLIVGRGTVSSDLLSPGEYKRLARHLREIKHQPADLVSTDSSEILHACKPVIDESRLQRLLGRGFLLGQVIERWQARAIWVVSRADADYPRRLKVRLREDAPAVIYGCGDMSLLDAGGIAVVGSRHVDDSLIKYTMAVGQLAARAGKTVVSGGAKGIDQAAMRGALETGGKVCGVLADSLEKAIMTRMNRNLLLDGQLVLISPYDPSAGFNVGNAMQRNKLIYALADISIVVSSDLNKGGTWAGAVEQLNKLKYVPVFVRTTGEASAGLDTLRKKGALPWPNPQDVGSFADLFNVQMPSTITSPQIGFSGTPTVDNASKAPFLPDAEQSTNAESETSAPVDIVLHTQPPSAVFESTPAATSEAVMPAGEINESPPPELTPAKMLYSAVRAAIEMLLNVPMKDTEVAAALDVSNAQAKVWLQSLVDDGVVEKLSKPVRYRASAQQQLFESKMHKKQLQQVALRHR